MNESLSLNSLISLIDNDGVNEVALTVLIAVNSACILKSLGSYVLKIESRACKLLCNSENVCFGSRHFLLDKLVCGVKCLGKGCDYVSRGVGSVGNELDALDSRSVGINDSVVERIYRFLCGRNVAVYCVTGLPGKSLKVLYSSVSTYVEKCLGLNRAVVLGNYENVDKVSLAVVVSVNAANVFFTVKLHVLNVSGGKKLCYNCKKLFVSLIVVRLFLFGNVESHCRVNRVDNTVSDSGRGYGSSGEELYRAKIVLCNAGIIIGIILHTSLTVSLCLAGYDSLGNVTVGINADSDKDGTLVSLDRNGNCMSDELVTVGYAVHSGNALRSAFGKLGDRLKIAVDNYAQGVVNLLCLSVLNNRIGYGINSREKHCDEKTYHAEHYYGH